VQRVARSRSPGTGLSWKSDEGVGRVAPNSAAVSELSIANEGGDADRLLRIGGLVALVTLAVAAAAAIAEIVSVDQSITAVGQGVLVAFVIFAVGATFATGLGTLRRRLHEVASLVAIAAAGLGLDLIVLAIWLDVEDETYGKITITMLLWAFLLFLVLALALATHGRGGVTRPLFLVTAAFAAVAGIALTHLIIDGRNAIDNPFSVLDTDLDGAELRLIGAALVVFSAGWFATLAASRLARDA
jgi:hypothetical protein